MILIDFLKKPEEFIKKTPNKTFFYIFILNMIVKTIYNKISSHQFPPEMNFDFVGIENPQMYEFILSHIISDILYFGIFLAILCLHLNEKFIVKLLFDIIYVAISIYLFKNSTQLNLITYIIFLSSTLFFLIKKNSNSYILLLKILIAIQLINISSTILLYLSEKISSNTLFIIVLFTYSTTSFAYFIKLIKSFFDPSIKKLILYLLISALFTLYFGFVIYKTGFFSSNTIKLILYN